MKMLILGCLVLLLTVTPRYSAAPADPGPPCSVTRSDTIQFLPFKRVYKLHDVVESFCLEGYSLKGANRSRCSSNGWEPALPNCEVTPCPPPPSIDNGRLVPKPKTEYASGEKVQYACNTGYNLEKRISEAVCEETRWKSIPACRRAGASCSTPPAIMFGDFLRPIQPNYHSGFEMEYKCPQYYTLLGNDIVKCTDGVWDEPPVCEEPCTAEQKEMRENNIVFRWMEAGKHDQFLGFVCDEGYGIANRSLLKVKCNKGVIPYPKCNKIVTPCAPPPSIDNGRLVPNLKTKYASGDKVHYECNTGYNLEKSISEAECEVNRWKSIPACRRAGATCSTPPTIMFGDFLGQVQPNYHSGFEMEYKCPQYYTLLGNEIVKCTDGVWDEPPVCLEPCTAEQKEMRENNIVFRWMEAGKHDQFLGFVCDEGYEIANRSLLKVKCNKGVIPYPKCNKIGSCLLSEETMKKQNIYVSRTSAIQDGEKVTFECNKGTIPEDTLEGTCKMRVLTYPRCITARPPCSVTRSDTIQFLPFKRVYKLHDVVESFCLEGYSLKGTNRSRCSSNGWEPALPNCEVESSG